MANLIIPIVEARMRFAYAAALLMMGSSAVLSSVLPSNPSVNYLNYPAVENLNKFLPTHNWNLPQAQTDSSTSAQLSHVYARQAVDRDFGKRYSPDDPNFLAAVTRALYDKRWAFYYDNNGFWTAPVAQAVIQHKYDDIYTMDQQRLVTWREKEHIKSIKRFEKEQKKQRKEVAKAERNKIKEDMKADIKKTKEAGKRKLKEADRKDRKRIKKEIKAEIKVIEQKAKDAIKANREELKRQNKEAKQRLKDSIKAAKESREEKTAELHKADIMNAEWAKKELTAATRRFFAGGGGPAIGEDNIQY